MCLFKIIFAVNGTIYHPETLLFNEASNRALFTQ